MAHALTLHRGPLAATLIAAAVACGGNAVNEECAREQQCADGPGAQTTATCESTWNSCIAELNAGSSPCVDLASALQDYASCVQGLSCGNRDDGDIALSSCGPQLTALWDRQTNASGAMCPLCSGVSPPQSMTMNPGG